MPRHFAWVRITHAIAAVSVLTLAFSGVAILMVHSHDGWVDSIDMLDALHPQTILAYGMNGRDLPVPHGAPVRLRVERQMGYKSMKFVNRIVVTDEFDNGGDKGNIQNGWAWYTGI